MEGWWFSRFHGFTGVRGATSLPARSTKLTRVGFPTLSRKEKIRKIVIPEPDARLMPLLSL